MGSWVQCRRSPVTVKGKPPKKGVFPEQFRKYKPRSHSWLAILDPIDSDILMNKLDNYFKSIEERNEENKEYPHLKKNPTIAWICLSLQITLDTLKNYVNDNKWKIEKSPYVSWKLKTSLFKVMDSHEQNLYKSNCTWSIFMLKSMFWIKEPPVEKAPEPWTTINNFNIILLHKKAEGTLSDTVIEWSVS